MDGVRKWKVDGVSSNIPTLILNAIAKTWDIRIFENVEMLDLTLFVILTLFVVQSARYFVKL